MLRMERSRCWLLSPELLLLAKGEGPMLQRDHGMFGVLKAEGQHLPAQAASSTASICCLLPQPLATMTVRRKPGRILVLAGPNQPYAARWPLASC